MLCLVTLLGGGGGGCVKLFGRETNQPFNDHRCTEGALDIFCSALHKTCIFSPKCCFAEKIVALHVVHHHFTYHPPSSPPTRKEKVSKKTKFLTRWKVFGQQILLCVEQKVLVSVTLYSTAAHCKVELPCRFAFGLRRFTFDHDFFTHDRDVNNDIMEMLIMAYACKTSSANKIIGVMPYLPYCKQSKMRKRGSIVSKLLATMMSRSGKLPFS